MTGRTRRILETSLSQYRNHLQHCELNLKHAKDELERAQRRATEWAAIVDEATKDVRAIEKELGE